MVETKWLTDAELLLLGLLAEAPRHGYQLERLIEERGMREWTQIGFSSIYFVLAKLEKTGLLAAEKSSGAKARKTFTITGKGRERLCAQALAALETPRPNHSTALLGIAHWPLLGREEALAALECRARAVDAEIVRLKTIIVERKPLPAFVLALFDYSLGQLGAEAQWIKRTHKRLG